MCYSYHHQVTTDKCWLNGDESAHEEIVWVHEKKGTWTRFKRNDDDYEFKSSKNTTIDEKTQKKVINKFKYNI